MKELVELISNYSLTDIVIILALLYVAGRWILSQISDIKDKFEGKKIEYHENEKKKETKDSELDSRLQTIETHLKSDYERIQKSESHLYQIETIMKKLNDDFTEMRIQSLRKQILDFTDKAVNVTNANISREAYDEIDRVYEEYEELLKSKGRSNGLIDYSYRCILHSLKTREENKLFLEDFYISPATSIGKIKEKNNTDNKENK